MEEFKYKEQYPYQTSACFNLTDACNLECRYCFVAQQPHFMTLETAKDGVKWLVKNAEWKKEHGYWREQDRVGVTYFGGEPTLLWDEIIVPLTRWAFETYPDLINFNITTNGTLLNEDRIKFLKAYNIRPLLSIDGAPRTQDYNRPCRDKNLKSSDLQYKNIPYLLKYFPDITFRSTIDENTVQYTFENYIFAQYMGFKNIYMMPNGRTRWKEENLKILEEQFKEIYLYIIDFFEQNKFPPISFDPINRSFKQVKNHNYYILQNIDTKKEKNNVERCGLGTVGCSIGYDGTIYGCQEQDSKGSESKFYLGNIYTGIDTVKHYDFLNEYFNAVPGCGDEPSYCDNCPMSNICGELHCPSTDYDLFKDFGKDSYTHCFWLRSMFMLAITTLKYLENNSTFKEYLIKECGYSFLKEGEK